MMQAPPTASRRLDDFAGRWLIDRDVNHGCGTRARMTGEARFSPSGDALICREEGRMQMAGAPPLQAVRTYLWCPGLEVYFEDGRYFHTVPPLGGAATHWCDPDLYEVIYDFAGWPDWTTLWTVHGPRKDYQMFTRFRPVLPTG